MSLHDKEIKKVDMTTRTIYLNEGIASDTVTDAVIAIMNINAYDDEMEGKMKEYKRPPIKVVVDSFGGIVYDGLGMVNAISSSKTPVHTYCYSKAMSMGFLIFISGHKRFIHKYATAMSHQLSGGARGTNQDLLESAEETNELNNMLMDITIKRTKITKEQLRDKNKHKQDWWMFGKKAIKLGVADELIKDTH